MRGKITFRYKKEEMQNPAQHTTRTGILQKTFEVETIEIFLWLRNSLSQHLTESRTALRRSWNVQCNRMTSEVYRAKLCAQIQQNDTKLITEHFTVEMDNDPEHTAKANIIKWCYSYSQVKVKNSFCLLTLS